MRSSMNLEIYLKMKEAVTIGELKKNLDYMKTTYYVSFILFKFRKYISSEFNSFNKIAWVNMFLSFNHFLDHIPLLPLSMLVLEQQHRRKRNSYFFVILIKLLVSWRRCDEPDKNHNTDETKKTGIVSNYIGLDWKVCVGFLQNYSWLYCTRLTELQGQR